jgi:hypothetical protein
MAKEIELEIKIDKNGKINAVPKGTVGTECLDLLKFLDTLNGAKNIITEFNEDLRKINNSQENIKNKLN